MEPVTPAGFIERFPGLVTGLTGEQVDRLVAAFEVNELGADEYVIVEWTTSDALFLVWDGELEALTDSPGGDRQVGLIGPGELLGDVSLLDPGPATASVVAPQGCTVLRMARASFDELRASDPAVASAIVRQLLWSLSARVRVATHQLEDLLAGAAGDGSAPEEALIDVHRRLYAGTAASTAGAERDG